MPDDDRITSACEAEWDKWKSDCSGFVKAVGKRLGVPLTGRANDLIDYFERAAEWDRLGTDGAAATVRANEGCFVIGGLKDDPHGHVVVVVRSAPGTYPVAYWGRFGAVGKKHTTINWSWNRDDRPKVRFYARRIP